MTISELYYVPLIPFREDGRCWMADGWCLMADGICWMDENRDDKASSVQLGWNYTKLGKISIHSLFMDEMNFFMCIIPQYPSDKVGTNLIQKVLEKWEKCHRAEYAQCHVQKGGIRILLEIDWYHYQGASTAPMCILRHQTMTKTPMS